MAVAGEDNRKRPNCRKRRQRGRAKEAQSPAAERGWHGGQGPRLRKRDFPETGPGFQDCACAAAPHPPTLLPTLPDLRVPGEVRNVRCEAVLECAGLRGDSLCI